MKPPGIVERGIGYVILLVLIAIALGFLRSQSHFNPAVTEVLAVPVAGTNETLPVGSGATALSMPCPNGFTPMGAAEYFNSDSLADKIDGKAELYLGAGFKKMTSQRFAMKGGAQNWFEFFVYEMKDATAAYAVFSIQRRVGARALSGAENGYASDNAVFLTRGNFYAELVAADPQMIAAIEAAAMKWAGPQMAEKKPRGTPDFLPMQSQIPGSAELLAEDAFGFDQFKQVYAAQYEFAGKKGLLFVKQCGSPDEARKLVEAYKEFLIKNEGNPVQLADCPGAVVTTLYDEYEAAFAEDGIVAGVHEAPDVAWTAQAVKMLREHLREVLK